MAHRKGTPFAKVTRTCRHCARSFVGERSSRWCSTECRLMGAAIPNGECLEWRQDRTRRGYGRARYEGKRVEAHRLAYRLFVGDPGERYVLHSCDNRCCINPKHLSLGTHQDNMDDMVAKGRQAYGELRPQSKLTAVQVKAISDSKERGVDLARRFDISQQTVCDIRKRRSWKCLDA